MKIAFVVNDVMTEEAAYTTTRLAMAAVNLGHASYYLGVGDFIYSPDGSIHAHARSANGGTYASLEDYLTVVQDKEQERERINLDEMDVVLLRNDPSDDALDRPWAQTSGILFGQLAAMRGVIVLNDPFSLANALNKTYFQQFPEQVRPKTCISRDVRDIKAFIAEQNAKVVIKPLQGSGGQNVFLIAENEKANLNQMIEAVIRDGFCIAQEYLPGAVDGDVRLFVLNGRPLMKDGKYAAFRRRNDTGDARSNMHTGGKGEECDVTNTMLELVEMVRPKLVHDGIFLCGLDIVDDKLIAAIQKFGADVEISPKKTYVSLRRSKQFGLIQPTTKTRLDVGINLKREPPTDRLETSGSFNAMVSHRVRVSAAADVDQELVGWLKRAYESA